MQHSLLYNWEYLQHAVKLILWYHVHFAVGSSPHSGSAGHPKEQTHLPKVVTRAKQGHYLAEVLR